MVDCKNLFVNLDKSKEDFGTVIQRCVSYYRSLHSTAALEGKEVNVINSLNTSIFAGNKLFTHMLLVKHGIPTPFSAVAFSEDAALGLLEKRGYPMVLKPTIGSWGRMIALLKDRDLGQGMMESKEKGLVVHEINNTTEYKNTVRVTGVDIPALMIDYAIKSRK